jgi:hypothetical protein
MSDSFEEYAQAKIIELRNEADALERALIDYRKKQGKPAQPIFPPGSNVTPIRKPKLAPSRARKGTKRSFVLAKIRESVGGATTAELWDQVRSRYSDMKRSSLRAMLYTEVKSGNIEHRGNRYVLKQERPSAPTLGQSD